MAIRCPNCGNENPDDYAFCDECGARLTADTSGPPPATAGAMPPVAPTMAAPAGVGGLARCPNCGAENVAGAAFCDECGAALTPAPAGITVDSPTQTDAPRAGLVGAGAGGAGDHPVEGPAVQTTTPTGPAYGAPATPVDASYGAPATPGAGTVQETTVATESAAAAGPGDAVGGAGGAVVGGVLGAVVGGPVGAAIGAALGGAAGAGAAHLAQEGDL